MSEKPWEERLQDWMIGVLIAPLTAVQGRHWTLRLLGMALCLPWGIAVMALWLVPMILTLVVGMFRSLGEPE